MRIEKTVLLAMAAALALPVSAAAQSFPSKPVTIVVPFPPGGSVDGVARILAANLAERTGKSFVVENRAGGAGGSVGSATVLRSDPDGHTLLFNASIHVITPIINANIKYDVVNDFTHVAQVAAGPLLVMTHPSVPANNLKQFFDLVKAEPAKYTIATTGLGSAGHLTVEFLKLQAKVEAKTLPYRGAGPALNDLVGGHIHLLADPMLSALPNVKAGKLKALAVTTSKRTPLAPEVPTVAENGMPPFEMVSWYAVWGPKGLDSEAMKFLGQHIAEAARSDAFKGKLAPLGFEATYRNSTDLKAYITDEMKRYDPIIKAAKIKVE
jgi:tripartite-type tricarboxylate transporter receptor subunit TctC